MIISTVLKNYTKKIPGNCDYFSLIAEWCREPNIVETTILK